MSEPSVPVEPELHETNMKPLLGLAVQEAVKLALVDTAAKTDEQRFEWTWDIYAMPDDALVGIDPGALAQNVACRLLGSGGWFSGTTYAGNATPTEVLHSCIQRPDQDPIDEIAFDLGLKPIENDDNV